MKITIIDVTRTASMVGWSQDEVHSVLIYVKLSSWSDELLHYQRQTAELQQVFSLLSSQIDYPQPPSVSGTSWSESHLSVLRWIMSGATVGTKVRTQQLSKHQSGYHFQSGCWPHLRVNRGPRSVSNWTAIYAKNRLIAVRLTEKHTQAASRRMMTGCLCLVWSGVLSACDLLDLDRPPKHQHGGWFSIRFKLFDLLLWLKHKI